jgi:hypothetical protein
MDWHPSQPTNAAPRVDDSEPPAVIRRTTDDASKPSSLRARVPQASLGLSSMGQSSSLSHDSASGLRRSPFYALLKVQVALGEPQWKSASAAASASARKSGGSSEQRADAFLAQISNEENKLLLQPIFEHFGTYFS